MEPANDWMRAAVLHGIGDLRYEPVTVPPTRPDEVLVRITMNGLCGSDIHFFKEGELGPFVVDRPYIPGHEACGIVVREAATPGGPLDRVTEAFSFAADHPAETIKVMVQGSR